MDGQKLSCETIARAVLGSPLKRQGQELLRRCPYPARHQHGDAHPSLAINASKNLFMCARCGTSGTAWALAAFLSGLNASDKPGITRWLREHGLPNGTHAAGKPEAIYPYVAEDGSLLFEVLRYPGKKFIQRRPTGRWKSGENRNW